MNDMTLKNAPFDPGDFVRMVGEERIGTVVSSSLKVTYVTYRNDAGFPVRAAMLKATTQFCQRCGEFVSDNGVGCGDCDED